MNKLFKSLVLAGLGALLLAGCIVTGTFVITKKIDDFAASTSGTFDAVDVDVTQEDVWIDHKDNIKNISDVRFHGTIGNNSNNPAAGQIYFSNHSTYETPDQVREAADDGDAILVFSGFTIQPQEQYILTFSESAKYRQNLDRALKLIETGRFYMYALTPDDIFSLQVTHAYVLLVLDAGK